MLSRLENPNDQAVIARKEAELLIAGFCEVNAEDIPQPGEYRKFCFPDAGQCVMHVIEWEDEVPVGSQIPMHAG